MYQAASQLSPIVLIGLMQFSLSKMINLQISRIMGDLVLELKVSHSYDGSEISLKNISLIVNKAEKVSVLGPSGSGKSTLLRLIAGLEKPYSGTITIQGKIVSDQDHMVAPEKRNVGLVVQNKALFPHLTWKRILDLESEKTKRKLKLLPIS